MGWHGWLQGSVALNCSASSPVPGFRLQHASQPQDEEIIEYRGLSFLSEVRAESILSQLSSTSTSKDVGRVVPAAGGIVFGRPDPSYFRDYVGSQLGTVG